jgi:hypothetical protein
LAKTYNLSGHEVETNNTALETDGEQERWTKVDQRREEANRMGCEYTTGNCSDVERPRRSAVGVETVRRQPRKRQTASKVVTAVSPDRAVESAVTRQFEKIAIGGEFTLQVSGSQVSNHITFFPDCAVPSCLITGAGRFDAATKMFGKIRFSGEFTIETSGCQVWYHFTLAPKTAVEYLTVPRGANIK